MVLAAVLLYANPASPQTASDALNFELEARRLIDGAENAESPSFRGCRPVLPESQLDLNPHFLSGPSRDFNL